jgi:RNA polymerase sigma-70 factor (ECF subfamily)
MAADALSLISQGTVKAAGKAGGRSVWAPKRTIQSSSGMASEAWGRATETELIREAQKGSRTAFEALVRQYDQPVLRLALRLTGSEQDAQDIHQEAFLKAYRYLANCRFECSF